MSLPLLGAGMATDGFDPLSISGLQFWVDANDSATLYTDSTLTTLAVSDSDVIGGWKDKSGNSRNALQNDGAKKPLLKTAFLNGRNVVSFGATRQELTTTASWSIGLYTAFIVRKFNTLSSSRFLYWAGNPAGSLNSLGHGFTVAETEYIQIASSSYLVLVSGISSTAWGQVTDQQASLSGLTRLKFRQNGSNIAGTFVGTLDPTVPQSFPLTIGGLGHAFNFPLDGYISEFLIYDSVLSGSDILLVEAYLKAKWGTP